MKTNGDNGEKGRKKDTCGDVVAYCVFFSCAIMNLHGVVKFAATFFWAFSQGVLMNAIRCVYLTHINHTNIVNILFSTLISFLASVMRRAHVQCTTTCQHTSNIQYHRLDGGNSQYTRYAVNYHKYTKYLHSLIWTNSLFSFHLYSPTSFCLYCLMQFATFVW